MSLRCVSNVRTCVRAYVRTYVRTSHFLFAPYLPNYWADFDEMLTVGRHSDVVTRVCDLATFVKYSRVKLEIRENRKSLITQKVKFRSC